VTRSSRRWSATIRRIAIPINGRDSSCRLVYQYEVVTVTSPVMRAQHA
jgi:hypothetical protein